jgi:hypothetical protein
MSAAELLEITMLLREEAQRSFEYWLTITFAFIAATFIGRELLKPRIAFAFAALYFLTVALLISRYITSGSTAYRYLDLAIELGAEPFVESAFVTYLRLAVFISSTLCTVWFLYLNTRDHNSNR